MPICSKTAFGGARARPKTAKSGRIRFRLAVFVLAAGGVVAGCGRSGSASAGKVALSPEHPTKVSFQLDWYPSAEHGGFFDAQAKGFYRKHGLDVEIRAGGPGAYPYLFVSGGKAEFALGRSDDVMLAVRQGLPLVIVCAQMEHDPQALMIHDESPVHSFADLDGKAVMANAGAAYIAYLQKQYHVKLNLIPMDYGLGHFLSDRSFIQQVFVSNEPFFVAKQGQKVRTLLVANGGYDPYRVIVTSRQFADAHPDEVRAFVAGTIEGYVDFMHGDPAPAEAKIARENPTQTPELMAFCISELKSHRLVEGDPAKGERAGWIAPGRMEAQQRMLVDLKILDAPQPLSSFADFSFLPSG